MVGEAALPSGADLGIELVDEVDDVEGSIGSGSRSIAASAAADAGAGDADRQVRLAGARAADQDQVALLAEEAAAREVAHSLMQGYRP